MEIFWTVIFSVLPFCSLANSTDHAFAPPPFRGSGLRLHCRGSTSSPSGNQPVAGPSMAAYVHSKNSSMTFLNDCRIALQFCTLLSRHPWLDIGWQERLKNPSICHSELDSESKITITQRDAEPHICIRCVQMWHDSLLC